MPSWPNLLQGELASCDMSASLGALEKATVAPGRRDPGSGHLLSATNERLVQSVCQVLCMNRAAPGFPRMFSASPKKFHRLFPSGSVRGATTPPPPLHFRRAVPSSKSLLPFFDVIWPIYEFMPRDDCHRQDLLKATTANFTPSQKPPSLLSSPPLFVRGGACNKALLV